MSRAQLSDAINLNLRQSVPLVKISNKMWILLNQEKTKE